MAAGWVCEWVWESEWGLDSTKRTTGPTPSPKIVGLAVNLFGQVGSDGVKPQRVREHYLCD